MYKEDKHKHKLAYHRKRCVGCTKFMWVCGYCNVYKAYGINAGSIPACFTMGRGPILLSNEGKTHKGVESFVCCHIYMVNLRKQNIT